MGWLINCTEAQCGKQTRATDVVDLIQNHTDAHGWFSCSCGKPGYIKKSFELVVLFSVDTLGYYWNGREIKHYRLARGQMSIDFLDGAAYGHASWCADPCPERTDEKITLFKPFWRQISTSL